MRKLLTGAIVGVALLGYQPTVQAAGEIPPLMTRDWSFDGIFGSYDDASKQRGLQVFNEICAACHKLEHIHFRNLTDLGYTEEEVEAFAEQFFVTDGPDEFGDMFERPALPKDKWPSPYRNDAEAAMIHGKTPPDMSLIAKARVGGPDYLYSLLLGYDEDKGLELDPGNYWNEFFPGNIIAMPPQLYPDMVVYADGTAATPEQMAYDVSNFLMWTAEPKLEERKQLGIGFMLFCTVMALVFYGMMRRVWADVKK